MTVWQLGNSSHLLPATEPCVWSCCIWCEYIRLYGTKYDLISSGCGGGGGGAPGGGRGGGGGGGGLIGFWGRNSGGCFKKVVFFCGWGVGG